MRTRVTVALVIVLLKRIDGLVVLCAACHELFHQNGRLTGRSPVSVANRTWTADRQGDDPPFSSFSVSLPMRARACL
jgi:hypothetical protein